MGKIVSARRRIHELDQEPLLNKSMSRGDMGVPMKVPPGGVGIKDYGHSRPQYCGGTNLWISIGISVPCAVAYMFYNNWLLKKAPFPLLVTLLQMVVVLICTQVAKHTTSLFSSSANGAKDLGWGSYLLRVLFVSLSFSSYMILSNVAMTKLELSVIRMLSSTQLMFFGMGFVLFGFEASTRSAACHIIVSTAACIFICIASSKGDSTALGITAQLGANWLFSVMILTAATAFAETRSLSAGNLNINDGDDGSNDVKYSGGAPPNSPSDIMDHQPQQQHHIPVAHSSPLALTLPSIICHAAPVATIFTLLFFLATESYTVTWEQVAVVGLPAFLINGFLYFASVLCGSVVAIAAPLPVISLATAGTDAIIVIGGVSILGENIGWGAVFGMVIGWSSSFFYREGRVKNDVNPGSKQMIQQYIYHRRSREPPSIPEANESLRYYKGEWIPQEHIPEMVETGDLVLFTSAPSLTGKGIGSAAVRLGVSVSAWHHFAEQGWHKDYCRIVLRRLNWPARGRRGHLGERLEEFADAVNGKKYGLNLCGLICGGTLRNWNDPARTYFCSEIVAEGYKFLGLLPPDSCAARYVPGDFSEGSQLAFPEGVTIGGEFKIAFSGRWEGFEQATNFAIRSF
eukprot:jgi/Bigna1/89771/estExt_fgenesh1_pg.C_550058